MIEFLKMSWTIFGLKAPWFSWVAAIALLSWPIYEIMRLFFVFRVQKKNLETATRKIEAIRKEHAFRGNEGLSVAGLDKLQLHFQAMPIFKPIWQSFQSILIYRKDKRGDSDQVWTTESADKYFSESALLDPQINRKFFLSIPGIVTGTGLLFTFLAILIALLDVRIAETKVVGLEGLIGGLSGKFVSSVAALFSATVFLCLEKALFYRFNLKRQTLTSAIDNLIPRLSTTQVMADIQYEIAEQTGAFKIFNADLATKLKNSFNESMGPTLERMVIAIEELNQLIRAAEQNKQESIAGEIESLLRNLEYSIVTALEKMGSDFNTSLSGSTQGQFNKVAEIIGSTGTFLEGLNSQFASSQEVLRSLIEMANKSTSELMAQTTRSATDSSARMESVLLNLTSDLSEKVSKLSEQMIRTIEETSLKSTETAGDLIQEVGNVSARNVEQLSRLLEKHESELNRVENLEGVLEKMLMQFNGAIENHGNITRDLKQAANHVSSSVESFAAIAGKIKETQNSMQTVTTLVTTQIQSLGNANQQQKEVWNNIYEAMKRYEEIFYKVDNNAKTLLQQVGQNMNVFADTTKKHFDTIVSIADNHMSSAVGKLAGSIEELQEQLDELQTVVNDIINMMKKVR